MANISTNTDCSVTFTEEEKEIFQKASEICKRVGHEIWQMGNGTDKEDQVSFFFSELGGCIDNATNGKYFAP